MAYGASAEFELLIEIRDILSDMRDLLQAQAGATTVTRCRCGHTWPKGAPDVHTCGLAATA